MERMVFEMGLDEKVEFQEIAMWVSENASSKRSTIKAHTKTNQETKIRCFCICVCVFCIAPKDNTVQSCSIVV